MIKSINPLKAFSLQSLYGFPDADADRIIYVLCALAQ